MSSLKRILSPKARELFSSKKPAKSTATAAIPGTEIMAKHVLLLRCALVETGAILSNDINLKVPINFLDVHYLIERYLIFGRIDGDPPLKNSIIFTKPFRTVNGCVRVSIQKIECEVKKYLNPEILKEFYGD